MLSFAQKMVIALMLCIAVLIARLDQLSSATHPIEKTETSGTRYQEGHWEKWREPITVVTAFLVAVGLAQLGLFWRQLGFIRESLDDAKKAADAAEGAASAATKQAKIAEATLTQLERPYVFIFDVKEFGFDPETSEFFVEYSVANYGKMPAIIEGAYISFVFSDKGVPPLPTLMADSHVLLTAPILQVGEKREKIREYVPTGMTTGDIEIDVTDADDPFGKTGAIGPVFDVPKGNDVFFRAIIEYRGPSSHGHSTGALWLANYPANGQFAQRGGDEYNYIK